MTARTIYLTMMYAGTLITMAYNMAAAILRALGDRKKSAYCHVYCRMSEHCARSAVRYPLRLGHSGRCRRDAARAAVCIRVLRQCAAENPGCVRRKAGLATERQCDPAAVPPCLPLALQHFVIVISGIIMQAVINTCGFVFLAGFTATNKLHGLMDCSASAFGYAASTYTGQNWGANRLDRVRMGVRSTLVLALSFSALLAAA